VKKRTDFMEVLIWLAVFGGGGALAYRHFHPAPPQPVAEIAPDEKAPEPAPVLPRPATPVPAPSRIAATPAPASEPMPAAVASASVESPAKPENVSAAAAVQPKPAPATQTAPLVLDATAGKKTENLQRTDAALADAMLNGKWNDYLDLLDRSLAVELKKSFGFRAPNDYDRFLGNPLFYKALLQRTVLRHLGSEARSAITSGTSYHDFYQWLLNAPEAMESLIVSLEPEDNAREVLHVWAVLAGEDPEARTKYRELALACALVFDKPFTPQWNGETLNIPASQRYDFYKQHNEKGDLATRIHHMPATDLVYVVCAPVPISELDWALKKMRLRQKNWGNAYGMVKYDMEKAVTGKMKKPYESYTFAEILDKGGICGDRAYFATNTARALGIPAVVLGGDGSRGPHAWFGWMSGENEWSFSGRMGGYSAGHGSDAQTGKGVSEQAFVRRGDKRESAPTALLKAHRFLWLADLHGTLNDAPAADNAIAFSLQASSHLAAAWEAKIALWRTARKDAPVEQWRDLVADLKKAFADDAEMLATAKPIEEQFVFARQDAKVSLQQLKHDTKKIEEPRGRNAGKPGDSEFLTESLRRQAKLLRDAGNPEGVHSLYRKALDEHAGDVAVFKSVSGDYFAAFSGAAEDQRKALRQIDSLFERRVDTKSLDYFDVESQNSVRALLVKWYREVGDEQHAKQLEKKAGKLDEKAKRNAI
jgi:hypothetical protein